MTIEEIKEWRQQRISSGTYNSNWKLDEGFAIIDTLLAEVAHLDADLDRVEVIANTQRHQLAVATEALRSIAVPYKDGNMSREDMIQSARTALERTKG